MGLSISSHHQSCYQGAIEGDHMGWIEFCRLQWKEITYAGGIKSSVVYHGCPIIFLTLNPGDLHSPISLYYAGEKIDPKCFLPQWYTASYRLKIMLQNPLAVVEYFHTLVDTIIETVFKQQLFGDLRHYYGTIEYQGRGTPHIHMTVCSQVVF